jgi:dolichol-phosphate mannosyltransferase
MDDSSPPDFPSGPVSLVIPAYNEAAGIRQAIAEADTALARFAPDYEILVVDDGSQDATAAIVREAAQANPRLRLLQHEINRGYGAALRTGFEAARFDRVAFTDADCQFDLSDLARLVSLAERYPLVAGYRVNRQDPWQRRFYSWGYNLLVRSLLGTRVRDCDCALKVFRKEVLAELLPQTQGFFVNAEILTRARQRGHAVVEVGVRHRPRQHGRSKVSLSDIPRTLATLLPFWWTRVLFPGQRAGENGSTGERKKGTTGDREKAGSRSSPPPVLPFSSSFLLLVLVAGLLFFARLGCPLQEPQEARYAEIPRQMLAEGSWGVPVLHGQPYYDKPPLLYWLVMTSYTVFGVHDWAARLVPGSAAFLSVLLTYWWGRRTVGDRAGFVGALILCLSARYVQLGRLLTMDGLLCLWVVAALAAGHVAVQGARLQRGWWLLSAAAAALGLLTKGPVALVLVVPPLLVFQALDNRSARPGFGAWSVYLAAALGLAAPWFVWMAVSDPNFLGYFFWFHHAVRFLAPVDHEEPFWFYLPNLLLGMLPWTLLLPALVRFLLRRSGITMRRPAALGCFLLAFLWSLLFFSAAGCKRAAYILPAMPPLALALGCYLDAALPRERVRRAGAALWQRRSVLAYRATVLVVVVGLGIGLLAVLSGLRRPSDGLLLALIAGGVLAAALWRREGRRAAGSWALCGAATFALLLVGVHELLPSYARRFSLRGQVRPHAELGADPSLPVICYPRRWDSVSFYLGRSDVRVYTPDRRAALIAALQTQPQTLVFVKSGLHHRELMRALPPELEFVPRGRGGSVTVGLVRPRPEVSSSILTRR